MNDDPQKQLCAERILSLGYHNINISRKQGEFASAIYHISAERDGQRTQLIYKLPPPEREGGDDILFQLGSALSRWSPRPIRQFEDEPKATVTEYAGEPILSSRPALCPSDAKVRMKRLEAVSDALAELHLDTFESAASWVRSGVLSPYAYSRAWADGLVGKMERLFLNGKLVFSEDETKRLRSIVDSFYGAYSADSMRGPVAFTHGDPHWGNVLQRGGAIVFIDWEWCNAASPMRDISILLQEEPDDALVEHIARRHAEQLVKGGLPSEPDDLRQDFERMMLDNTLMMARWNIELFVRGAVGLEELRRMFSAKLSRIGQYWNRICGEGYTADRLSSTGKKRGQG